MTRAKPAYDTDGSWKHRVFDPPEWELLKKRLLIKLMPFYPDKSAEEDPTFGHPAVGWTNYLLSESWSAVSVTLRILRRRTNEELRVERDDLLQTLNKAVVCLSTVSRDLDIMFGTDADVLGTRDKINALIPHIEDSKTKIANLPKAKKLRDANHFAAVEMAIRVLRVLKAKGGTTAATADKDLGYISDAVKILKIIGDELNLCLDETTWKKVIIKAKKSASDLR